MKEEMELAAGRGKRSRRKMSNGIVDAEGDEDGKEVAAGVKTKAGARNGAGE